MFPYPRFHLQYFLIFLFLLVLLPVLNLFAPHIPNCIHNNVSNFKFISNHHHHHNHHTKPSPTIKNEDNSSSSKTNGSVTELPQPRRPVVEETLNSKDKVIILDFPSGKSVHDNKRLLNIYNFLWTGQGWQKSLKIYDVCLATQSSLDRLYWLPSILEKWDGPLSIAVHITSVEEWLILNLFWGYLRRCNVNIDEQVAIHMAIPATVGDHAFISITEDNPLLLKLIGSMTWMQVKHRQRSCGKTKEYLRFLLKTFPVTSKDTLALKEVYPQNHMRNIARKACGIGWIISTDIDIIPSSGMAELIQEFYITLQAKPNNCKKCAFVIPTFELDYNVPFPSSKEEIVSHFHSGKARPFHYNVFAMGHNATNYKLWTETNLEDGPVKVSHEIIRSEISRYEPFYVSSDLIPPYDERFLGYGSTRNTQFQEALYTDWKFFVLTPIYSIHWGLQSSKTLLSTKRKGVGDSVRTEQTEKNYKKYVGFMKELKFKQKEKLF